MGSSIEELLEATSTSDNATMECAKQLLNAVAYINAKIHRDYRNSDDYKSGADMYAVTIIGVFAFIIILVMFKSIKPTEDVDDQVTNMMASMQLRVDVEETARRKRKMKEAKKRAQEWLKDIKQSSLRSLSRVGSRRSRNQSFDDHASDSTFIPKHHSRLRQSDSVTVENELRIPGKQKVVRQMTSFSAGEFRQNSTGSFPINASPIMTMGMPSRAKSHLGFVPEIVVTEHQRPPSPPSRLHTLSLTLTPNTIIRRSSLSRQSSVGSYNSGVLSAAVSEDIVFEFPDCSTSTGSHDSPPYLP